MQPLGCQACLRGVIITVEQLERAKSLELTILPDGTKHP